MQVLEGNHDIVTKVDQNSVVKSVRCGLTALPENQEPWKFEEFSSGQMRIQTGDDDGWVNAYVTVCDW